MLQFSLKAIALPHSFASAGARAVHVPQLMLQECNSKQVFSRSRMAGAANTSYYFPTAAIFSRRRSRERK